MSIRQRLNDNPRATGGVVGALVLIAVIVMLRPACSAPAAGGGANAGVTKEFFTVDDGKTWFADDSSKLPPFDHQGKPAVRARVYKCGNGKEFVSHLERYADPERQQLADALAKDPNDLGVTRLLSAVEVKKPGGKEWVKNTPRTAARFTAVTIPRCPGGPTTSIQRVMPK